MKELLYEELKHLKIKPNSCRSIFMKILNEYNILYIKAKIKKHVIFKNLILLHLYMLDNI